MTVNSAPHASKRGRTQGRQKTTLVRLSFWGVAFVLSGQRKMIEYGYEFHGR
jgi:hypothetical protein